MTTTINSFPNVTGQMPFGNAAPLGPFMTPEQQRIKTLEDTVARLEARLAEKDASASVDLDKALSNVPGGGEYLRARYDGITKILTEWALTNPMLSQKVTAFLDGWKAQAQAFLNGKETQNDHPGG